LAEPRMSSSLLLVRSRCPVHADHTVAGDD
jgi:hypothetical protein